MKFSKFNLIIKEGNKRVLFNTLSGECFKISTGVEEIIDNNLPDQLNKELYDDFLKKGIIVDDQVEENRYFSYIQNQTRFNNSVLSATVLLTWACNLACIYCYEGAGCRTTRMNKATADRFIGFMINQAKARNSKSMYINLFGGEPLLNIECGFYILDALKKFCAEKNIEFASGIITNGTLLTAEIVSQLINYNCQQIQITLDGMPDTHNARRKYKDGKGSFEQIISALELLNNKCADIHTVIRINVDKNNLDEVSTLLEYLGINGKGLTNCNVDFGIVRGSTQACSAYSGNCLSESIVGEVLSKLWSKAEMEGFTLYTKPFHRWIYCGLYADSQFTVTPNGELYKCWEHAGDEQHLMGNINENGNIDNIKYSFYDWMSHNPLENEECKECVYLPACGGGCGVVGAFYRFCANNFIDFKDYCAEVENPYEKVPEMDESTLKGWLVNSAVAISEELKNARNTTSRRIVEKAKGIVRDRYMQPDLSLDTVCSELGVSNSYFSSLFKKETGKTFISWLTDYRMDHAADLMLETNEKSYKIAERVGYQDANYFSYVFKKRFGMSPSKYRTEH